MVLATLHRSVLAGISRPPPSISLARRMLWYANMGEGGVVGHLPDHPDMQLIMDMGREMGAEGVLENGVADIFGPHVPYPPDSLSCKGNATLSRLLLPLSLLTLQPAHLTHLRLPASSSKWIDRAAASIGVRAVKTTSGIDVSGTPDTGVLEFRDRAGAFWAPGVMMAAPLGDFPITMVLDEFTSRQPSFRLTLASLEKMRMDFTWEELEPTLTLFPGQTYPELNVEVEADWRTGSYLLGALLLAGRGAAVLPRESVQAERAFWLGLETDGLVRWNEAEDAIWAQAGETISLPSSLDLRSWPALIPLALVLATQASAPVRIEPLFPLSPRSRYRLVFMAQQLAQIGASVQIEETYVQITPGPLAGGEVSSGGDARIAMALALAGLISKNPVLLSGAESATHAYPAFWESFKSLGAVVELDFSKAPALTPANVDDASPPENSGGEENVSGEGKIPEEGKP